MPLRLIDVGPPDGTVEPFLSVAPGRMGKYVTLSYRWGLSKPFRTLKSNLQELCRIIPMEKLPQTVQDAVKVTRWLGVRYLWVEYVQAHG
jgi:hypothetical protein